MKGPVELRTGNMEPLKSPPMMQSIAGTTGAEPAGGRGLPTTADTAVQHVTVMTAAGKTTTRSLPDVLLDDVQGVDLAAKF